MMVIITTIMTLIGENMLDDFDNRMIHLLVTDGRMSVNELSDKINLSPTPVSRRLKKLESDGIIRGYGALIDERRLGFTFSVFVSVRLEKQIDDELAHFEAAVTAMPEVVDCWLMTGNHDYLLRVVTRDIEDFERFLVGQLTRVHGVASIESSIPLRRVKAGTARYR